MLTAPESPIGSGTPRTRVPEHFARCGQGYPESLINLPHLNFLPLTISSISSKKEITNLFTNRSTTLSFTMADAKVYRSTAITSPNIAVCKCVSHFPHALAGQSLLTAVSF